ncbi:uncharacterized protein LOC110444407, partial [Mizuhopecten yessoensis]|uniref:uncharacterized protein LOC110444407 n=1 Tax=Mizuhopecten yessoensis TaxID=6573 RepID=UPI000B459E35
YSAVGAKPDLLCREIKFPEVLDPTVTGGQGASNQDKNGATGQHVEEASASAAPFQAFDVQFPTGASDPLDINLDEVTLANNILDGQFLPSFPVSSPQSSNTVPSSRCNRPSSVGLQNSAESQKRLVRHDSVPLEGSRQNSVQGQNQIDSSIVRRQGAIQNVSQTELASIPQTNIDRSRGSNSFSFDRRLSSGTDTVTEGKVSVSSDNSFKQDAWESDVFSSIPTSVSVPKATITNETSSSRQGSPPSSIPSSVAGLTSKRQEETLSNSNVGTVPNTAVMQEMKQIRSESQAAVKTVVQEYKVIDQWTVFQ